MKKQNLIIVCLVLIFFTIFIGYSVFDVSVNASLKTAPSKEIKVDFMSIGDIKQYGSSRATARISDDKKYVFFDVPNLFYQGAYVIIPITVKNVGFVPAKLLAINEYGISKKDAITVDYGGAAITDMTLEPQEASDFYLKVAWSNSSTLDNEKASFKIKLYYIQE